MDVNHSDNFSVLAWLTRPSKYLVEPGDRRNAGLLAGLLLIVMVGGLLNGIVQLIFVPDFAEIFQMVILGVTLLGVAYGFSRSRHYKIGAVIASLIISMVSYFNLLQHPHDVIAVGFILVGIFVGSMFLDMRFTMILAFLNIIMVGAIPRLAHESAVMSDIIGASGFLILMSSLIVLTKYHRNAIEQDRQEIILQTQAKLQASYDQLSNVLEHMPIMVCALDMNGNTVMWNEEATRITGYTAAEVIGNQQMQSILNYQTDDEQTSSVQGNEISIINRQQETKFLSFFKMSNEFPVPGWSMWGVAVDLTDHKRNEQVLLAHARLQISFQKERDRNTITQNIISALSHDVKIPLTVINLSADMLKHYDTNLTEEERQLKLDSIANQTGLVLQLLDDTMQMISTDFAETLFRPTMVNLATLCEVSINEIDLANQQKHQLIFINSLKLDIVSIDERLVSRILMNLLSNAIKYSPEGSEIKLELDRQDDWIVLRVTDEGIGINPDALPHIFEPLYRADEVQKIHGTGIGLHTVKECVERHNGHISVETTVGKGTTFTVQLPLKLSNE